MFSTREVIELLRTANPEADVREDHLRLALRQGKVSRPCSFAGRFAWTAQEIQELADALGLRFEDEPHGTRVS